MEHGICGTDLRSKLKADFPPLSEQREDWLSANSTNAKELRTVARSSLIPEIRIVTDPIVTLVTSVECEHPNDARGSDFHRWRVQTDGIVVVARNELVRAASSFEHVFRPAGRGRPPPHSPRLPIAPRSGPWWLGP